MVHFAPLLLFVTTATITPGPNNLMLMHSGLNFGVRKTLPHLFGILCGFPTMFFVIALGFGAFLLQHPGFQLILKLLGCAYILYLAWCMVKPAAKVTDNQQVVTKKKPMRFIEAVLFQWVNPKAWMMIIGLLAVSHLSGNYVVNAILLSLLNLSVFVPCGLIWLTLGAALQKQLSDPKKKRLFNQIMAVALVSSLVLMLIE